MSGIAVQWYNEEQTILQWTITGRWLWEDYTQAWDTSFAMQDTVNHTVDIVFVFQGNPVMPHNLLSLHENAYTVGHPRTRFRIAVGASPLLKLLAQTLISTLMPQFRLDFVNTMDEALALLERMRAEATEAAPQNPEVTGTRK